MSTASRAYTVHLLSGLESKHYGVNRIHVMERAMQINDPNSGSGL